MNCVGGLWLPHERAQLPCMRRFPLQPTLSCVTAAFPRAQPLSPCLSCASADCPWPRGSTCYLATATHSWLPRVFTGLCVPHLIARRARRVTGGFPPQHPSPLEPPGATHWHGLRVSKFEWSRTDLNRRHVELQSTALPTELHDQD